MALENGIDRDSDDSGQDDGTPKGDKMEIDELGNSSGRVTRGES